MGVTSVETRVDVGKSNLAYFMPYGLTILGLEPDTAPEEIFCPFCGWQLLVPWTGENDFSPLEESEKCPQCGAEYEFIFDGDHSMAFGVATSDAFWREIGRRDIKGVYGDCLTMITYRAHLNPDVMLVRIPNVMMAMIAKKVA